MMTMCIISIFGPQRARPMLDIGISTSSPSIMASTGGQISEKQNKKELEPKWFLELRPVLRLLNLIHVFYKMYVPNVYNRSNRSNRLTRSDTFNVAEGQQFIK